MSEPRSSRDRSSAPTTTSRASLFAFTGALTSCIAILAAVVRSKVTAKVIGPAGLGVFAEAQQLCTLALTLAGVAVGPALMTRLARDLHDERRADAGRAVGAAAVLGAALGATALFVVGLGYRHLITSAAQRPVPELLALAAGSLLVTLTQACGSLLVALALVKRIALQATLVAVIGAAVHVSFVVAFGVGGQFYGILLAGMGAFAVTLWLARSTGVPIELGWDSRFARDAFRIGTTSLVAGGLAQAASTVLRIALDRAGGPAEGAMYNGQYQAALTIGSQYFAMVTTGLGTYFFPRYASAQTPAELEREVGAAVDFALRVAPPIVFVVLAIRAPIIHLLYSDRFDGAISILGYQLAGDVAKGVSWAYAGPLLFRGDLRGYLITEGVGALLQIGLGLPCIRLLGLQGAGISYTGTYLVYMFVAAIITARFQRIRIRRAHLWLGTLGTLGAASSELLRRSFPRMDVVLVVVAGIWAWRAGGIASAIRMARRTRARLRGQRSP